jgi:putative membrane protein
MSRIRARSAAAVAALGIAAVPVGIAQAGDDSHGHRHDGERQHHPAPAPAPVDAQAFVVQATQSNTFEIVSSELALERSKHPAVRRIAEHLIRDHALAQQQLAAIAAEVGLKVPEPSLNSEQQAIVAELRDLWGKAFDAAYLQAQVVAHEQAIALFVGFASNDANPRPLRLFAIQTLPVLGRHLGEVRAELEDRHHH